MKLSRITNANRPPKSSMNIEVAHVAVEGANYVQKLEAAFEASFKVEEELQLSRYGFRSVRSLLVDDKRRPTLDRDEWFSELVENLGDHMRKIDYVAFESDLKNTLNVFYSRIIADKQNTVKNNFERYLAKRKRTGCSHDISLWHAMRLGALGSRGLPIFEIKRSKDELTALRGSFVATNVCSILPVADRNFEEDAETDILRHLDNRFGDWRRIKRYYYDT